MEPESSENGVTAHVEEIEVLKRVYDASEDGRMERERRRVMGL